MSFYNKELSNYIPHSSTSGCTAPSDSKSLEAFPSPVSLWLQVVIPYFKNRVQSDMCQDTEIDLQKVKWHLEPWLHISFTFGTKKVSVLKHLLMDASN